MQTAMIAAGVGTLIQLFAVWKVGTRLPLVMGVSFTLMKSFGDRGMGYGEGGKRPFTKRSFPPSPQILPILQDICPAPLSGRPCPCDGR
ncbi:hypothetical protein [Mailhella sp.]